MREQEKLQLIQTALDSESIDDIVDATAHFLGCPLVVISTTSTIISYSRALTPQDETWLRAVERGYITLEFVATLSNWEEIKETVGKYECVTVSINSRRRRFFKLTHRNQLLGYLNVTELDEHFDSTSRDDCHLVSQIIAKEVYMRFKRSDGTDSSSDSEFLMELLQGSFVNRGHFIDRLALSGFNSAKLYRLLCIDLKDFSSYNADEDTLKKELLGIIPTGVMLAYEKTLIILSEDKYFSGENAYIVLPKIDKLLKSRKLLCGISDSINDLFQFSRFYSQALNAIKYRKYLIDLSAAYTFYDDVKVYDILQQIPQRELLGYCSRQVYDIYQHDRSRQTEYIPTLLAYLYSNRSVKATARYMNVHRNTVNYRIAKIKELFNLDLDNFNNAYQIALSCQIIKLLQE